LSHPSQKIGTDTDRRQQTHPRNRSRPPGENRQIPRHHLAGCARIENFLPSKVRENKKNPGEETQSLSQRLQSRKRPEPPNCNTQNESHHRTTSEEDAQGKGDSNLCPSLDQSSKANAKVRDLDIVISKISTHRPEVSVDNQIAKIEETRESQLQAARRQTLTLQKQPIPKVGKKNLSNPKLQKRLNKTTDQLILAINTRLPLVIQDSSNARDLHLLRIDCRRLRYLADLFGSRKTARLLSRLRSWHDPLGFIHDSDLTIDYLRNLGEGHEMQPILNDLVAQRMHSYEKFSSIAKPISPANLVP